MNRLNLKKSTLFMGAGLLLMAASLALMFYIRWDEKRADAAARAILEKMDPVLEELTGESSGHSPAEFPDYKRTSGLEMPEEEIDGNMYIGELEIPSLGLKLPVMSRWSYPNLKISPCRYQGSAYQDDLIIAAHNYTCHFGRLGSLLAGDEICFTDMEGNRFCYQVMEIETLEPTAIEQMCGGDWDLTLFTCTYGGRARLTVRCAGIDRR